MAQDRRDPAWLDAALDRHLDDASRMADALVELDGHPGHLLLTAAVPTGRTGERWAVAGPALHGLWRDFDTYRDVLRRAGEVRDRRARPGRVEVDELHRLLVEPTIEVARRAVALHERGLTGDAERVETIDLDALVARMHDAHRLVSELVVRCDELSSAALGGLTPLVERARRARECADELGLDDGDPDVVVIVACSDRLAGLERVASSDPLALDDDPPGRVLAEVGSELSGVRLRLDETAAMVRDWPRVRAELGTAVQRTDRRRADVERVREQAAERVAGPCPTMPPARGPALHAALARLDATTGAAARESGAVSLRRAVADADRELAGVHELAAGLLERREELRGRFGAYRARAVRLGRAEDPALCELAARIEATLWSRPSDLGSATRDLASYRRSLTAPAGDSADSAGGTR